jgi:xanthine dehydrogenase accessory factor
MNTQRIEVLTALRNTLEDGRPAFLVTVLETWGASPRPAGSVLVFDPVANRVLGSVSGGCVEEDLLEHLRSPASLQNASAFPRIERYGADASGYALPCGAEIELLIELFDPQEHGYGLEHVRGLLRAVSGVRSLYRRVCLGSQSLELAYQLPHGGHGEVWRSGEYIFLRCCAADKLLLIGATDVAQSLAPIARQLGYQVTICEPRQTFLARQALSAGVESIEVVSDRLPDDLVYQSYFDESSAVIALAHDPRVDDLAIYAALQGGAHFVGAMGSQRNAQLRAERLAGLGLSESLLEKLKAPVGLMIGSHTPIEIAISIAAQLVDVRRERTNVLLQGSSTANFDSLIDNASV